MTFSRALLAVVVAAVSLVLRGRQPDTTANRIPFEAKFRAICGDRWLDRAAQIKAESNFDPNARSFDGGEGLGQATGIWPEYIRRGWVPNDSTPFQVGPAIMGANAYMISLETQLGSWRAGYCGYNAGARSIQKAQRLAKLAKYPAPMTDGFLQALPEVTGKASRWTINYDRNIRAIRADYRRKGLG